MATSKSCSEISNNFNTADIPDILSLSCYIYLS